MPDIDRQALYTDALKELYRRDFVRFAKEQLFITGTGPGQIINFYPLTAGQELLHNLVEKQRRETGWVRVVLIKRRQMGGSTYTAGRAFHLAALNQGVSTLELAHDGDTAASIFEKCKLFYDRIGELVKPMRRYDNLSILKFENPDPRTRSTYPGLNSKMTFSHAKNLKVGTGTTQHFIHMTEAAKFDVNFSNLLESSLFPGLHLVPGTWCINESTAYVGGDYFRSCCERARSKKTEWRFCFVPWYITYADRIPLAKGEKFKLTADEKYIAKLAAAGQPDDGVPPWTITPEQFNWRRMIISGREDGENIFKQEYPTVYDDAWINVDLEVFPQDAMMRARPHLTNPERFVAISSGKLNTTTMQHLSANENYCAVWKEPERNHKYDIGVDTSVGVEDGDWSVAEVFDRETHEQVAELHYLVGGIDLAQMVYWLGMYYNQAQIGVEMASTGFTVNAELQRMGYSYLYIWRHRERAFPTLSTYSGWKTQRDSKVFMIDRSRDWVIKDRLIIHSHVLWNEMRHYVRVPGATPEYDQYRADASGPGWDDATMATMISLIIGDDESSGLLHAARIDIEKPRRQLIEEEMAKGGPAFRDDTDAGKMVSTVEKVKNSMKGWSY